MKTQNIAQCVLLLLFTFLSSCSSLQLTSSWTKPSTMRQAGKRILVVSYSIHTGDKAIGENTMAQALNNLGYSAAPSANLLHSPSSYPNEQSFNQAVLALGYDAILSVICTSKKTQTYIPGTTYYVPVGGYVGFYHFYHYYYELRETPAHTETDYQFFYQTNLYDIKQSGGEQLLYTSTSQSFDYDLSIISTRFCKVITRDMQQKGVL